MQCHNKNYDQSFKQHIALVGLDFSLGFSFSARDELKEREKASKVKVGFRWRLQQNYWVFIGNTTNWALCRFIFLIRWWKKRDGGGVEGWKGCLFRERHWRRFFEVCREKSL
jgi:hypothetical protein